MINENKVSHHWLHGSVALQQKIVKVKIEPCENSEYPFRITSLEKDIKIGGSSDFGEGWDYYNIIDPSFIELYPTQEAGEKAELEKLHKHFAEQRRTLREQQRRYKWSLKQVQEYKSFKRNSDTIF